MKKILNNIRRVLRKVEDKHRQEDPVWLPGETLEENIERRIHGPLRRKGIMLPGESYYEYLERTHLKSMREKGMLGTTDPLNPWKNKNMI